MGSEKKSLLNDRSFPKKELPVNKRIETNSPGLSLVTLQRTLGNNAFGGILQTRLKVDEPGDIYEKEADRVADEVVRMPEPGIQTFVNDEEELQMKSAPAIQTKCEACEHEEEINQKPLIQRKDGSGINQMSSPEISTAIRSKRGSGRPLPKQTQQEMSGKIGADFSGVRVHNDSQSKQLNRDLGAKAFTVGNDIFFNCGQYRPDSRVGKRLLAHELVHVVQQASNPTHDTSALRMDAADSSVKGVAERVGEAVSKAEANPCSVSLHVNAPVIARAPRPKNGTRRRDGRAARSHAEKPEGRDRSLISMDMDTAPARIDNSMTVDQITKEFYQIPNELIPPGTNIPAGPILTIGPHGCRIRRYGLTIDEFSLELDFDDADVRSQSHPFNILGERMQTVQCWTDHVGIRVRIRNAIWLPSDLATHPCLRGEDPGRYRTETLAHERLHEADNNAAALETMRRLRDRLAFTPGVGSMMAMVRITDDPMSFVEECKERLRTTLERLRDEHEIVYRRISAESAIKLDPHDRELHELKLHLLQEARANRAESE